MNQSRDIEAGHGPFGRIGVMVQMMAVVSLVLAGHSPVVARPTEKAGPDSPLIVNESAVQAIPFVGPPPRPAGRLIVLGFGGDLGFSGKDQPLTPAGAIRHGRIIPWSDLTSGLAPLLKVDAAFANLETVITDRGDLAPASRSYNFAASPEGIFAVARAGINVLTTANNHSADYGSAGILQTLKHLEAARLRGLKAHAGLG